MEETISLKELLEMFKKRFLLIVLITITAVLVSGVVSYFFMTPIYQASTQILVNKTQNDQSLYTANEVQTNLQLINTYNVIIKSPAILDKAAKELNLGLTGDQLNSKITVSNETNSQVVTLAVKDPDPNTAATIANTIASVFEQQISKIMKVDNVTILAKATVTPNQAPVKPRPLLNMVIALVVGLMAGVGVAFLLEYFDNTIKNEQDIEKVLGLPILGVTANMDEADAEGRKIHKSETRKAEVKGESIGS